MITGKPFFEGLSFFAKGIDNRKLLCYNKVTQANRNRTNKAVKKCFHNFRQERAKTNSQEWLFSFSQLIMPTAEHAGAHPVGASAYLSALTSNAI